MDVRLPNGTIMKNVPDGTSAREIQAKAVQSGLARVEDFPSHPVVDAEANRAQAVGGMLESLPMLERFAIGVKEPIAQAGARLGDLFGADTSGLQQWVDYSRNANDAATNVGRVVPAIAATSRIPAGLIPTVAGGAAYGAATGEDVASGATGGAIGGAAGSIAGGMLGRGINAAAGKWADRAIQGTDDAARTIERFQQLGGRILPGQASGSPMRQSVDEMLANNPLTASAYGAIERGNKSLLTKITAKAVGVTSDDIGPAALSQADSALEVAFNRVADQLDAVPLDKSMADDIARILRSGDVKPYLTEMESGALSGRGYMHLRSRLLQITRGNSDKVDEAWSIIDDLDETVERIAPKGYKELYSAARERYKSLLSVDKYRRTITGGEVNPLTMDSALRQVFRKQYTRDMPTILPETKDMFTAVRAMADPRMAPLTGGSPTAKRLLPWLTGSAGAAGLYADPLTGAAALGAAYMAPRAALAAPADPLLRKAGQSIGIGTENVR